MELTLLSNAAQVSSYSQDTAAPWLAIRRVKGLGCLGFKKLVEPFADANRIFTASRSELELVEDLRVEAIDGILHFDEWADVAAEIAQARNLGISLICYNDPSYPARLRAIADPPPVLYTKGELIAADEKAVAIVGSRSASDYGRRVARDLARGLAGVGVTVVSGMARGIDGMAHEAALNAGGRTLAVLGSGVERAYPPEHDKLHARISGNGAVLSELSIGTRPLAFNFPARNRLISGLSLGVVVVEATEKSGSLITASMAVEQGREVFAVPGQVGSSRSRGAHRLIRQGANLVESVEDILAEIAPQLLARGGVTQNAIPTLPPNTSAETQKIFALLQDGALQVDEAIEKSGMGAPRVLQILLELELQGFVTQLAGKKYTVERAR
jgi:DNA processing protein